MFEQHLQNLSPEERDHLLERLLIERSSEAAKTGEEWATIDAIDTQFCTELPDEVIFASTEVACSLECIIDDYMTPMRWEIESDLIDAVMEAMVAPIEAMLRFDRDKVCNALNGEVDTGFLEHVRGLMPENIDEAKRTALLSALLDEVPDIINRAFVWRVDNNAVDSAIVDLIRRFLSAELVANAKAQVCKTDLPLDFEVTSH